MPDGGTTIRNRTFDEALLLRGGNDGATSTHNLQGQFNTLSGHIGGVSGSGVAYTTFRFVGDGEVLRTFRMRFTDEAMPISINVSGVNTLEIHSNSTSSTRTWGFGGATLE
ncbi:MAG: hypothetical protein FWC16_13960 [Defluviitaleaceae bacterium]|nr:hypothetical protein [Defluviitaleaceae bacterium]MCL2276017.1 hypothetical protein [Defluviitaleaceae bacterium]